LRVMHDSAEKYEGALTGAVRNSLNDVDLEVEIRPSRSKGYWRSRLRDAELASEWISLTVNDLEIMDRIGVIPALQLGDFRVANESLRQKP
jgi:hypothetical protein